MYLLYGVRTLMENLEMSWNLKVVIFRPGKEGGKIPKVLEKSWKLVLFTRSFTLSLK